METNELVWKQSIDNSIESDRFSMNGLFVLLSSMPGFINLNDYDYLEKIFGSISTKKLFIGIIRFAFLIEIVKVPKIETTKFESRWGQRLSEDDPRQADFDECLEIYRYSVSKLIDCINKSHENIEVVNSFLKKTQVAYEIPLDYKSRIIDGKIHTVSNVDWYFDDLVKKVAKLRDLLLNPNTNPHFELFARVYKKIQVKSYLTDRVLTGIHKTNREKRWETHPGSVHFAFRKTCQEVEYTLVKQIFGFDQIPSDLLNLFKSVESVEQLVSPFRCPITMDPLSFPLFETELLSPIHGKSSFQVGHLNPLKAINGDETYGHTAKNISWISSDGNRIQGSLSLIETRNLIKRISENYKEFSL